MKRTTSRALQLFCLLALLVLIASPLAPEAGDTPADAPIEHPIFASMMQSVGQAVANDAARVFGEDSPQHCIVTQELAMCIHPDTPPERMEEILRSLPTWTGDDDRYTLGQRWTTTATDGPTGGAGGPINLTYSFLDDGVWIPGSEEPGSGSRLYAEMNLHFGDEATWKALFAEMFNDWGKHIGVSYVEVSDDGATFPNSSGELGLRGDVRIGAHFIDGINGVLAYNYFPNTGDMVLDISENWSAPYNNYVFMRNICRHEHGHGIGLQHVAPIACQKLMEPYICTNFDGPQDDDIRGGMRSYGDIFEYNNTANAATDLGALDRLFSPVLPVSITTSVDYDYYKFTTTGASLLNVVVDPYGFHYNLEGVIIDTDAIMDLAFRVLGGPNGSEILAQVNDTGLGDNEVIVDFALPAAGEYWVLVYRAGGTHDVQRYDIDIDVELTDITGVDPDGVPVADLGLSLYPNPFNPRTTARFYATTAGPVILDVYDVAGRHVRTIRDQSATVGWQKLAWDGRNDAGASVPSGAYLMQVQAGGRVQNVRGLLLE